jgi:hypothetical protein
MPLTKRIIRLHCECKKLEQVKNIIPQRRQQKLRLTIAPFFCSILIKERLLNPNINEKWKNKIVVPSSFPRLANKNIIYLNG